MVKIYLSINNSEEVILLPVTPPNLELERSWDNQEVKGLNQSFNLGGNEELKKISIESFFPIRDYPFSLNNTMYGMEYVETIERWTKNKYPIRIIIINEKVSAFNLNMPVLIEKFNTKVGKDDDIYYTMDLREFKFVEES